MSLVNVVADFEGIVAQLRRIADALDRLNPPVTEGELKPRTLVSGGIIQYGKDEERWVKEEFENLGRERGLPPKEIQKQVEEKLREYRRMTKLEDR